MKIDVLRPRWKRFEKQMFKAMGKLSEQDYPLFGKFSIVTGFDKSPYDNLHTQDLTSETIREAVEKLEQFRRQHGKAKRNDKKRHSRSR